MQKPLNINEISVKNFKSLYNLTIHPGNVNVFIGANGSGKSSILEAIGVLSAAIADRVNDNSLQRKGVRLSAPGLYKSKFSSIEKESPTVDFCLGWEYLRNKYIYSAYLNTPKEDDSWKYFAENVTKNGENIHGRSNRSSQVLNNKIGSYSLAPELASEEDSEIIRYIADYGIYQPDTLTLRGTVPDPTQTTPIGLNGGRLAEAINDLLNKKDDDVLLGNMYMEDVLELIDWAAEFKVTKPKKSTLNSSIPTTQQIIEFRDRYLKDAASFTGYDASEGALYVLFMLTLAMHESAPKMFAIDSFDHSMNPRLAKKVTEVFCNIILENGKTVFMTTHNPLVLDGLDLSDERVRLFATERDSNGFVKVKRIEVSEKLLKEGQPLSRLWINGLLGGVPELL